MQLIIDFGNTRIKLALFKNNELISTHSFINTEQIIASEIISTSPIKNAIVVSVVNNIEPFITLLKKQFPVLLYNNNTPTPLENKYTSPLTLGGDRLAAAVGANTIFPNEPVLLIDAGTCIKYNLISAKNEFIGGSISPGLEMRFKAINSFTARLPLLKADVDFNTLIGKDTTENIISGVALGATAEINGIIDEYKAIYPAIKVVLTGGDSLFFEKRLKSTIFVDETITLKGLNRILNFNTDSPFS